MKQCVRTTVDSSLAISSGHGIMPDSMREDDVLFSAGCSSDIIAHCRKVSALAVSLAERVKGTVDGELVRRGGLFHDIGRSRTHDIGHALAGVEIGRAVGFSEQLLLIIERHIGAGIPSREAVLLGLPEKEYLPETREEKIVSYADNLMSGIREMEYHEALDRFKRILGPDHAGVERFRQQHREIQGWMK
jgi:uncharacterized protein